MELKKARVRAISGPLDAEEQRLNERERAVMASEALDEFLDQAAPSRAVPRLLLDHSSEPFRTIDIVPNPKIK